MSAKRIACRYGKNGYFGICSCPKCRAQEGRAANDRVVDALANGLKNYKARHGETALKDFLRGYLNRSLAARYATPPPQPTLTWLETAHFMPTDNSTVLLAWPFLDSFTFRTGRFHAGKWWPSDDTQPRKKPVFFADLA